MTTMTCSAQQHDLSRAYRLPEIVDLDCRWSCLPSIEEVALRLFRASQERGQSQGIVSRDVDSDNQWNRQAKLPSVDEIALQLFNAVEKRLQRERSTESLPSPMLDTSIEHSLSESTNPNIEFSSLPAEVLDHILSLSSFETQSQLLEVDTRLHKITEKYLVREIGDFIKQDKHFERWEFKSLKDLELVKQLRINFGGLKEIPASIALLSNLKSLELIGNEITEIPETLQHLSKLAVINLDNNQFTTYPAVLSKMKNIQIHLRGNPLHIAPTISLIKGGGASTRYCYR